MNDERFVSSEETVDEGRTGREGRPTKKVKYNPMKVDKCSKVNVRAEADTDSTVEILTTLNRGTVVQVDPSFKDSDFYMVKLSGGLTGYVRKDYLVEL